MNSYIQLVSLLSSFIYGLFLYYLNCFNYNLILKKNILLKIVISVLYIFNMSLSFVCFLYWLNGGILHIYNILFIILGYVFISVKNRK